MGLGIPSVTASLWLADSLDAASAKGTEAVEKAELKEDEQKNKDESFFRSVWESAKDTASGMASVRRRARWMLGTTCLVFFFFQARPRC